MDQCCFNFLITAESVNKQGVISTGASCGLFRPLASEAVCVSGALIPNAARSETCTWDQWVLGTLYSSHPTRAITQAKPCPLLLSHHTHDSSSAQCRPMSVIFPTSIPHSQPTQYWLFIQVFHPNTIGSADFATVT